MIGRHRFLSVLVIAAAIVVQTSVFGRFRLGVMAPDFVLLVLLLLTVRRPPTTSLIASFLAGLTLDALSADALGLRAMVYTAVIFLALRTRDRAEAGPVATAVWIGLLTFVGVVLLGLMGTLFGQVEWAGRRSLWAMLVVPALNLILALMMLPMIDRIQRPAVRLP